MAFGHAQKNSKISALQLVPKYTRKLDLRGSTNTTTNTSSTDTKPDRVSLGRRRVLSSTPCSWLFPTKTNCSYVLYVLNECCFHMESTCICDDNSVWRVLCAREAKINRKVLSVFSLEEHKPETRYVFYVTSVKMSVICQLWILSEELKCALIEIWWQLWNSWILFRLWLNGCPQIMVFLQHVILFTFRCKKIK